MPQWLKTTAKLSGLLLISALAVLTLAVYFDPNFGAGLDVRTEGAWGTVLAILALILTLLKQIIAFIGFLTTAIKILIVLIFVAVFLFIGLLVLRTLKTAQNKQE